ncbi:transcriptional regulator, SarA/Rot family [Staphylococcus lutrae]|uniref:MarR family transcriptional regulator n=1 Tax=Staphylococcus lutrae TaxID=155085 RepID=A0AAC9RT74_9STAP|nr:MarR family transcriptional regulator [Staphylococcus lutrae]ARJ50442.1 MarR family transcriptional regulator [Staphylococcus lutrae]PNZ38788.1 MarR family transcriptional regulator [Staphylococcus lutrae]
MEKFQIKNMKELMKISCTTKCIYAEIKKKYGLTYEELFILTFILEHKSATYNVKDIIKASKFKPYYITKAMQKLKDYGFLTKKRNEQDERTVIIEVSKAQYEKIEQLFSEIEVLL